MRDALYIIWIILGSSGLLLLCFFVFQLVKNPGWFSEANRLKHRETTPQKVQSCIMFVSIIPLFISCYQLSILCLGWMPEHLTPIKEGLSICFTLLAGGYLAVGIGRGIVARVELAYIKARDNFWNDFEFNSIKDPKAAIKETRRFRVQRDLYTPYSAPVGLLVLADRLEKVKGEKDFYGENFERLADEIIRKIERGDEKNS
jgi:hypothetical protein